MFGICNLELDLGQFLKIHELESEKKDVLSMTLLFRMGIKGHLDYACLFHLLQY